ncbi:MAG: Smr/MutS family protein [Chitinophagales bacterium]|nr:Smr/MutS family protein [Chitinophagales bacterium]
MSKKSENKSEKIDTDLIRHFMLGGTSDKDAQRISKKHSAKVDLHLDETSRDYDLLADSEKLDAQLQHLEKQINRAIANGNHKIEVIHGKGAGKLKAAVEKYLKHHPAVKNYRLLEDKARQGGATEVVFK